MIPSEKIKLILGLPTPLLCLLSSIVGVAAHLGYFIHRYRVPIVLRIIVLHVLACLTVALSEVLHDGPFRGLLRATAINVSYFFGLFASISIYRVFFHRLSGFPGPFAAKVTKFYGPWIARTKQVHVAHTELHKTYGNFVRMGECRRGSLRRGSPRRSLIQLLAPQAQTSSLSTRRI